MKRSSGLLALLASLAVMTCAACGGARTPAAAPESDPWAGYKGTYAPGGPAPEPATASATDSKPATTTTTAADSKPSRATESKVASAPEPKPKAAPKATASNDAKSMYGIESDSKTDALTPDAVATPAPKKPMKKRAGAVGGKKTVAKKAAKR